MSQTPDEIQLSDMKPYILRMYWEYIQANGLTPFIDVFADYPGTVVPRQYVKNGIITLNISDTGVAATSAAKHLMMKDDMITFQSSFGGKLMECRIPPQAVLIIRAREVGDLGQQFPVVMPAEEATQSATVETPTEAAPQSEKKRPTLTVVK